MQDLLHRSVTSSGPRISEPVISTVVLLDLIAPPAAMASAMADMASLLGIGNDDEITEAVPTSEQFAADRFTCLAAHGFDLVRWFLNLRRSGIHNRRWRVTRIGAERVALDVLLAKAVNAVRVADPVTPRLLDRVTIVPSVTNRLAPRAACCTVVARISQSIRRPIRPRHPRCRVKNNEDGVSHAVHFPRAA